MLDLSLIRAAKLEDDADARVHFVISFEFNGLQTFSAFALNDISCSAYDSDRNRNSQVRRLKKHSQPNICYFSGGRDTFSDETEEHLLRMQVHPSAALD